MQTLRALFRHRLDILSYYLTVFAIGAAGIGLAFSQNHPQRWPIVFLVADFSFFSLAGFAPRIVRNKSTVDLLLLMQSLIIIALVWIAPEMNFFVIWFYMTSVYAIIALPPAHAYGWVGLFALATVALLIHALGWMGGLTSAAIYLSGFAFFAIFARLTRQANAARAETERLLAELQQAHRDLQAYAAKAETLAAAEERNRLAREMHDTIGHRLTVSAVQLEAAERLIASQPERAAAAVATVRTQVRAALTELRQTVAALRQPLEGDLPLERSLPRLAAEFQQATGLQIHLSLPHDFPPLTPPQRLTLYRTAQEGLTNVHKHAAAQQVWLSLKNESGRLTLTIRDDGRGPQGKADGFGLRGLQERATHLGGAIRFEPAPQGGSLLTLTIPLKGTP